MNPRRHRPLGLSLAILSTGILYGMMPLLPVVFVLILRGSGHDLGADVVSPTTWITAGLAVLVLIVAVVAWLSHSPRSRWLLLGVVWIATAFYLIQIVQSLTPSPQSGTPEVGGSLSGANTSVLLCQVPLLILVPLYITWYLNRAPARAFYQSQTLDSRNGTQ